MGAFLDKPKTDKYTENGTGQGLRYGVSSMQGWRAEMEDAHCAMIGLPQDKLKDWSFFAVFDGHAGAKVSDYWSKRLLDVIIAGEEFSSEELSPESIQVRMKRGFLRSNDKIRLNAGDDESGSMAVSILISPDHIFVANCGDSRMVLSRASRCHFSTKDHKPINPQGKWRIQNDGSIKNMEVDSTLSRASSDLKDEPFADEKEWELLGPPEPDFFAIERSPEDEFAVLACDGVWDVMSNKELCDFVRHLMTLSDDLVSICNTVVDTYLSKKSRETISVIIVAFPGCPQISKEASSNDGQLDNKSNQLSEGYEPSSVPFSVFMLTGFNAKERKECVSVIESLGASVGDGLSSHLISHGDLLSEKFLACVSTGKWILHKSYLTACKEAGHFVKEEDYEWGSENILNKSPELTEQGRSIARASRSWRLKLQNQNKGAFSEVKCLVMTEAKKSEAFTKLLKTGGATIISNGGCYFCRVLFMSFVASTPSTCLPSCPVTEDRLRGSGASVSTCTMEVVFGLLDGLVSSSSLSSARWIIESPHKFLTSSHELSSFLESGMICPYSVWRYSSVPPHRFIPIERKGSEILIEYKSL